MSDSFEADVPATSQADDVLSRLTPAELRQWIDAAETRLQASREHAKSTLRAKFEALATEAGLSLDEALAVIRPAPTRRARATRSDKGTPRGGEVSRSRDRRDVVRQGPRAGLVEGVDREQFLAAE